MNSIGYQKENKLIFKFIFRLMSRIQTYTAFRLRIHCTHYLCQRLTLYTNIHYQTASKCYKRYEPSSFFSLPSFLVKRGDDTHAYLQVIILQILFVTVNRKINAIFLNLSKRYSKFCQIHIDSHSSSSYTYFKIGKWMIGSGMQRSLFILVIQLTPPNLCKKYFSGLLF